VCIGGEAVAASGSRRKDERGAITDTDKHLFDVSAAEVDVTG